MSFFKSISHPRAVYFVESHYPKYLLEYLKNTRRYNAEETSTGVYIVKGDIRRVIKKISMREKTVRGAYLDAIVRANNDSLREAYSMSDGKFLSLKEIFEEQGLADEWIVKGQARGEAIGVAKGEAIGIVKGQERKAIDIAEKMIRSGFPMETVASITELDPDRLKTLYQGGITERTD